MTELDRLKERISVIEVLELVGAEFADASLYDDEVSFFCPFCDDAGSSKPAGRANELKNLWHCFSCGRGGSVIDAAIEGLSKVASNVTAAQAVEWLLNEFPDEEVLDDPWALDR